MDARQNCNTKNYCFFFDFYRRLVQFSSSKDPFESIIQAKFTVFENEDADYPLITTIKKTGEMPNPRTTRAAQAIIKAREEAESKVLFPLL